MEFIKSQRGGVKICLEGFSYTKKKESKTTIRWECSQRKSQKCKGAIITDNPPTRKTDSTDHSHVNDPFYVEALKVRAEIVASAEANRGQPQQILADKMVNQPVEVRVAAGTTETIKRHIRYKKAGLTPKNPEKLAEIPVPFPEEFCTNLIYDNELPRNRILVFASEDGLGLLESATTWFMDGTHSTAPRVFEQVFAVRVPLGETSGTAAYALLPSKEQAAYEECLTAILDACLARDIRPTPSKVVCDYEVAIHNAVRRVMAHDIQIQGCFYHLTQSTWRHVQGDGLQAMYRADEEIRTFCGKLDGLAFLPTELVVDGMTAIKETAPAVLNGVIDYFDTTYVSGGFRSVRTEDGHMRFRRTPPRFQLDTWNVHEATLQGTARTNNLCEAWNNSFKSLVGHKHPSVWTVVSCFEKDAAMVEAEVLRVRRGVPSVMPKRKKTDTYQRKLTTICQQIQEGDKTLSEFLDVIGKLIRLE